MAFFKKIKLVVQDVSVTKFVILIQIRKQKQRPGVERISKWVLNHTPASSYSVDEIKDQLDKMSKSGRIIKVCS